MIKIRNLPELGALVKTIHVKPIPQLLAMMCIGVGCLFWNSVSAGIGVCLITLAVFSIWLLPDRVLVQCTPQYLVLYNSNDRTDCALIYWEDIVQWQYEWHASSDLLVIKLADGSSQSIEMYSKRSIAKFLYEFAPGKEVKNNRIKEEQQA